MNKTTEKKALSAKERWNARYLAAAQKEKRPEPFVCDCVSRLKHVGRALDVAAGTGRHALWLASLGFQVWAVDVSDVGLGRCRRLAEERSLADRIEVVVRDLERFPDLASQPGGPPLAQGRGSSRLEAATDRDERRCHGAAEESGPADLAGPWDLIVSSHYLQRSLLASLAQVLRPGGSFLMVQPTESNLERHAKPSRRFLVGAGELEAWARDEGLRILEYREGWSEAGQHLAQLWAQRPH